MSASYGKTKVLLVDDEEDVLELLEFNFKQAGFSVLRAETGEQALAKARTTAPDLIVLDLMLPEMDGMDICRTLRRERSTANIPIIMLTAKNAEIDRILGLEFGADDYVTKPFSPRELILRAKKLLKRHQTENELEDYYEIGPLVIDVPRHGVTVKGNPIELTATEFKLLHVLVKRRGRVQTRDQLLRDVWEYDTLIDTRTVDTHIRRLRDKLGAAAQYIDTIRNVGYRFSDNV